MPVVYFACICWEKNVKKASFYSGGRNVFVTHILDSFKMHENSGTELYFGLYC